MGNNVSSPGISRRGTILLGYSAMIVKKAMSSALNEIREGGNEELATNLSNIGVGVGLVIGTIESQGLILIPLAVDTANTVVNRSLGNARENRNRAYERTMRGSRVSYMQGGGYE